jgi:hypothetical protein
LIWAEDNNIVNAVVVDPPTGCKWDGADYVIGGEAISGYPSPGNPRIYFGPGVAVIREE